MESENGTKECCPPFSPVTWDNKEFQWNEKKFIKDKVFTLFYVPINFGPVIKRITSKVEKSGASILDWLCLSDHTSKWNMDVYCAVNKEVSGVNNVTLNGKYISKVYEGDFKDTQKWCDDYKAYVKDKGYDVHKWFMWYTTCPKCAKKYGKNYVVIIGEVK